MCKVKISIKMKISFNYLSKFQSAYRSHDLRRKSYIDTAILFSHIFERLKKIKIWVYLFNVPLYYYEMAILVRIQHLSERV